jgi:hypothetical protein
MPKAKARSAKAAASSPTPNSLRLVKIGANGAELAAEAAEWDAVLDRRTGLMWAVKPIKVSSWREAQVEKTAAAIAKLKTSGFKDWRIPTVDELFTIADRARTERPAIDVAFFPDCPSDWFWTSTPYAPSPGDYAWGVYFGDGSADWGSRGSYGFVRAVRAGQ